MATISNEQSRLCRRRSTTVLGIVVLILALLGLGLSTMLQLAWASRHSMAGEPDSTMRLHNTLLVLCKVALCVLGICIIRRYPRTRIVALVCLILSLLDSAYYTRNIVPQMQAGLHPTLAEAMSIGGWIVLVGTAAYYLVILWYLDRPATRTEFAPRLKKGLEVLD